MSYYPTPAQAPGPWAGGPGGPAGPDAPLPGASIGTAWSRFWHKYAVFTGRASRSEFWWWALIALVVSLVLNGLDRAVGGGGNMMTSPHLTLFSVISSLWGLATLVPGIAVGVRRLHDADHSGWWLLIGLVPVIGAIVLLVFLVSGPRPEGARFDARVLPAF